MKHIISLGAGVQSSTMALMAAKGEIGPMPEAAIFADTQAEPESVMRHLDWLETQLPFPVIRGTYGSLTDDSLRLRHRQKDGVPYLKTLIPAFVEGHGLLGRKCTADYKVAVIRRETKKLLGLRPADRWPKQQEVVQWLGISLDEIQRMKVSVEKWVEFRHPLIDARMTREDCLKWMSDNGYPEPPRSACVYCPFHSNAEWRRLKEHEPEEFQRAVEFERELQKIAVEAIDAGTIKGMPYLHRSWKPIDQVDLTDYNDQMELSFLDECAGMCGV